MNKRYAFLKKMRSATAANRWTIATNAKTMVFKYLHLQAGEQVYLIQ